jgi:hypothetical protein
MPALYSVHDVFGVARGVPANYVARPEADLAFVSALAQDKHIVIHGSSKQGKTSLRKHNLQSVEHLQVMCSHTWALSELHIAILKAAGYVVEGTTTRTTGGDFKIRAEVKAGVKLPFVGEVGGAGGTDVGHMEQETLEGKSLELDPNDVNDVIAGLEENSAPKYIVLEDFHYLPESTQRDFAVALKAFHESSAFNFVIIGVWLDENRLTQHNGDLVGRVVSINVDEWDEEHLTKVMVEGGRLLGIQFAPEFASAVVTSAVESVWIVQETCRLACVAADVLETRTELLVITGDAPALVKQVVDSSSARFTGFLSRFAHGFEETQLEIFKWLLFVVINADADLLESGIPYSHVCQEINDSHPQGPLEIPNIDAALASTAELQVGHLGVKPVILDYDPTARRLAVVDRSFLIWLRHQVREDLLEIISVV